MKRQKNTNRHSLWQLLALQILFVVCLCFVLIAVGNVDAGQKTENDKRVEDTIKKAVVNCYAIEGRYPATLQYVEEYYGLQIDRERYEVFYEVFADNIMPEITVVSKNKPGTNR